MKQEIQEQEVAVEESGKKSFKKSNAATLVLQIIFALLCAIIVAFELYLIISSVADVKANPLAFLGMVFSLPIMIGATVLTLLFIIPFILFMVFCKRPWIALAAYATLFICTIVYWVIFFNMGNITNNAENALQYLPLLTSLIM